MKTLSLSKLRALLSNGANVTLLEALPEKYYRQGHLPGARHFPSDQTPECMAADLPDREATIVVYCASDTCRNSHHVAEVLEEEGYTNVSVFVGGKKEWVEAGLALML